MMKSVSTKPPLKRVNSEHSLEDTKRVKVAVVFFIQFSPKMGICHTISQKVIIHTKQNYGDALHFTYFIPWM